MGNNNHPQIQADIQQHQRLGLIKFLDTPQNEDQFQKISVQQYVHSQKYYKDWLHNLSLINNDNNRQLFYIPQNITFQPSGVCGSSGTVHIEFQYFPFLLKNQIKNRRNINQFFQQTQIWYLLYKMVSAAAVFQKLHTKIGDFNPKSILLNQNGEIRIISIYSLPNQTDNYTKITQHVLADVFLAPQQISIKHIQSSKYPQKVDPNKAQMFCIGITLLQAASLQNCSFLFTRNPLKIQFEKLQKLRNNLTQRYSSFLCQVLKEMIEIDARKRRTGQNLVEILKPYENTILDLQPFNWNQVQYSSVKSSAFFNDSTINQRNGNYQMGFNNKNY